MSLAKNLRKARAKRRALKMRIVVHGRGRKPWLLLVLRFGGA